MARAIAKSAFDIDRPIRNDIPLTRMIASPSAVSIRTLIEFAVAGFATWKTCETHWIGRENFSPGWVTAANCPTTIPKEAIYDRAKNPSGVRCDLYDNEVNVYGRDPTTHFARRPLWDQRCVTGSL